MKKKILMPFILLSMLVTACHSTILINPEVDKEVTVDLDAATIKIDVGGSAEINALVSDNSSVTWVNSDPSVINMTTNSKKAQITGLSSGVAYVTAIAGIAFQTCTVTVGAGGSAINVTSISLNETNAVLEINDTFNLVADVKGNVGTPTIEWTSSDAMIASVSKTDSKSAIVTAKAVGEVVISATSGGKTASCQITVEDFSSATLAIKLDKTTVSLAAGETTQLNATTVPNNAVIDWQINDESVANISNTGLVTAQKVGTAVISATVSDGNISKTATCNIRVTGSSGGDYQQQIASWSKPGHLYLHYLRNTDTEYTKWALWMWQNYPKDSEGSLWGANLEYPLAVTAQTEGLMTNADCGLTGTDYYVDEYGVIFDVDLNLTDIKGGKSGVISPIIYEEQWDDKAAFDKLSLGFLIVDQSKMTGKSMWTSDGGAETYIRKFGKLMPEGKNSYLHVYCVEGNVTNYTTESGTQVVENPTLTDKTGQYRSQNDITDLKFDQYPNGVGTSSSFLDDEPGVGYQIFVPSFADSDGDGYGDIQGIISKLQYLDDLGVKVLWLTPIQESNSYHGYDVTDYYKIDQRFGTLKDYQQLIYEAHSRGMKVLMDMVINHTSKSNVLFQKSQRAEVEVNKITGKTINYRDMYLWKYEDDEILEWNGVEGSYSATNPATYVTKKVQESDDWYRDGTSNYYYFGKFGSGMAELNYSSQATRDYMTDMCKYWLSFGLDGFRLDAIKHIYLLSELNPNDFNNNYKKKDYITYDVSYRTYYNEETLSNMTVQNDYSYDRDLNVMFWKQFAGTIKSAYPNCFLVGENFDGWNERMAPFYEAIDSQFDFSTYYHLNEKPFEGMAYDISNSLKVYGGYRSKLINGAYTSNHDIARLLNHAAGHQERYVPLGEEAHHVEVNANNAKEAINNARVYAAYTLLSPGVSWIYYGDELGMSGNVNDKVMDSNGNYVNDHGNNVDRWYRQPMRWGTKYGENGVVNYRFSGLEVLWDNYNKNLATASEQQADPNSMFNLFSMAAYAKNDPNFPAYGAIKNYWSEVQGQMICMQISDGTRTVNVFINYSGNVLNISGINQGELIGCSYGGSATTVGAYGFTVIKK